MLNFLKIQENSTILPILNKIEEVFVVFSILFLSEGLFPILEIVGQNTIWQDFLRIVPPLLILVGTIILLIIYHQKVIFLAKKEKLLWLLLFLATISVSWSIAPVDSLRRVLVLLTTTLFGVYFAARYPFKKKLQLLGLTFSIITILCLLFVVFFPSYGIMGLGTNLVGEGQELEHQGIWRGIFQHKNTLGRIMVLSILTLSFNIKIKTYPIWILSIVCAFSVISVIKSNSRTALLIFAILLLFNLLIYFLSKQHIYLFTKKKILIFSSVGLGLLLLMANLNLKPFANSDLLLKLNQITSGRIEFWQILWDEINERFWFGYGFGGFWLVSPQSKELRLELGDWAAHGHNGFVDLMVDLGLVGLLLFTLIFLRSSFLSWFYWEKTQNIFYLWFVNYSIILLLLNITESTLLTGQASLYWFLYVDLVLSIGFYRKKLLKTKN